jgi:hypothetical protein
MKYLKGSILLILFEISLFSNGIAIAEAKKDYCSSENISIGVRIILNTLSTYNKDPTKRVSIILTLEKFLNSSFNQNLIKESFNDLLEVINFFDLTLLQNELLKALKVIYDFSLNSIKKSRRLLLNWVNNQNITMTEALDQFTKHRNDSISDFDRAYLNLKKIFKEYNETQVNIFIAKTQPKHQKSILCSLKSLEHTLFMVRRKIITF